MAGWYFSVNGRAEGPVSEAVLLDGLKSGKFTLVDLVFKEGSAGWTTLGEIPEFRGAYEALPAPQMRELGEDTDEITNTDFQIVAPAKPRAAEAPTPPAATTSKTTSTSQLLPVPAWIVLKKKGTGFEQVGPYSEGEIIEKIGAGEIEYSMYAWKPGYKRWVRIGNLPEFDRRKRDRENDPVNQVVPLPNPENFVKSVSREELASSIETLKRPDPRPRTEPPPVETNGVDLLEVRSPSTFKIDNKPLEREQKSNRPKGDERKEPSPMAGPSEDSDSSHVIGGSDATVVYSERTMNAAKAEIAAEIARGDEAPEEETRPREKKIKKAGMPFYQRAAVALVAAGFVVVGVLAAAQWWNAQRMKEDAARNAEVAEATVTPPVRQAAPPAPPPVDSGPSAEDVGEVGEPTADAQPEPSAPAPAQGKQAAINELGLRPIPPSANGVTVLEIVPMKLSTSTPLLVFQTDAAVGETIEVRIKARAGDILEWVTYTNGFLVRRGNGEIASLDLSKFSLPVGTYRVDASAGRIRKQTTIFLGVRDANFEAERREHMKNVSQIQQAEKKALFYSAQKLEKLAGDLGDQARKFKNQPAKWKKYYSGWKKSVKDGAKPALRFAKADRQEMVAYPEMFITFGELNDELTEQAKQVDASFTQKRAVANVPLPV
ncbi:MAG: DUF4339 domain-containing protein, partial [Bdellovibrionota bacterium]